MQRTRSLKTTGGKLLIPYQNILTINFKKNAAGLILAAFFYVQYMKTAVGWLYQIKQRKFSND
jgi:hypothetical protein